jgi:predicted O-methyltransferase YrrM
MEMTPARWRYMVEYARDVFGRQDPHLAGLMAEAVRSGLPDIAVSPPAGRLLTILASTTGGKLAIEVGTLGGYSGIWIVRGLAPGGRLITIDRDPGAAAFARRQFERAGVAGRVELRCGAAMDVLRGLARELDPGSVDVVFLDAEKTEYPDYWDLVRPLIARGGLILADNAFGSGSWWIDDVDDPSRRGADALNRLVAGDPDFEAVAVPIGQGLLIGRRRSPAGQSAPSV